MTSTHTCTECCAPDAAGSALCPRSPRYWRLPENRGDGKPYRETTPDEVYDGAQRSSL